MILRRIRAFYRREEAEEVLQEVFVRVLENQRSFRGESSPATWLYRLATNHCLDRLRKDGRRRELLSEYGFLLVAEAGGADPEARLLSGEVWRALDPELAEIAVHHLIDGMTQEEIARVLGCSRRTVGNRLEELRARLEAA
jgi:RNA polymerase sigma-70 factor (ECF subfamily)